MITPRTDQSVANIVVILSFRHPLDIIDGIGILPETLITRCLVHPEDQKAKKHFAQKGRRLYFHCPTQFQAHPISGRSGCLGFAMSSPIKSAMVDQFVDQSLDGPRNLISWSATQFEKIGDSLSNTSSNWLSKILSEAQPRCIIANSYLVKIQPGQTKSEGPLRKPIFSHSDP